MIKIIIKELIRRIKEHKKIHSCKEYDEEYINNLQGIDKEIFDLFQTLSNSEKRKYLKQLHRLLKI